MCNERVKQQRVRLRAANPAYIDSRYKYHTMNFLNRIRAPLIIGKALSKFYKNKYKEAANLFEKAYKLSNYYENKEVIESYLGRSYLALERYNDAEVLLSRAYEIYSSKKSSITDSHERKELLNMLKALSYVLEKTGQVERSREISIEISEMEREG